MRVRNDMVEELAGRVDVDMPMLLVRCGVSGLLGVGEDTSWTDVPVGNIAMLGDDSIEKGTGVIREPLKLRCEVDVVGELDEVLVVDSRVG